MGRVPSAGKEAKGAKTTPGCMEDEIRVLGLAILAHPRYASLVWHSAQHAGEDQRWAESKKQPDTSGYQGRASGRTPVY